MKVSKVIIEGFHNIVNKEYDFESVNYLYGKNGVGKSTVLQAIQLGLLGYVPGSNKTNKGTFTHSNNHTMAVTVILDDEGKEVSVQRVWTKVKNSVNVAVEIQPEGYDINQLVNELELPLFNFDEFAHMTANTLKDWFINYLPKQTFTTDWEKELTESISSLPDGVVDEDLIKDAVDHIRNFDSHGVEEIRRANDYFKAELSFMKKELDRKTAAIQSLVHYDDYVPTYSEEELQKLMLDTKLSIQQAIEAKNVKSRSQKIQEEMKSLAGESKEMDSLKEKHMKVSARIREIYENLVELENKCREATTEYESYNRVVNSNGTCVYTGQPCADITKLKGTYVQRQGELAAKIQELDEEIKPKQEEKIKLESEANSLMSKIQDLNYNAARYENLSRELMSLPDVISGLDAADLNRNLTEYEEMYSKAVANRQYSELNDVILKDKYRIQNTIECLKIWVKLTDVNGLQSSSDYNPFDVLSDCINVSLKKLFGDDVEAKFNIEGRANSFSFGIDRNGVYVPYNLLSSGEKCMFILSMYLGLLEYSHSPLKLILIDDFLDHLDDENFKSIFQVLTSTDIQYIFAGVKPVEENSCNIIEIS